MSKFLDLELYLTNNIKILQVDRFLELEKVLTGFSDKNEIKIEGTETDFDAIDSLFITKTRKNYHSYYNAHIPFAKEEEKSRTMEEFIRKCKNDAGYLISWKKPSYQNTWNARYEFSMNFIALFLDECFFSSFLKQSDEAFISWPTEGSACEELKILKFFLAELYEHAATADMDQCSLRMHTFKFSAKRIKILSSFIEYGLDLFYKLIVDGHLYTSTAKPKPRYRDICSFKSFDILLKSLKEYQEESATKLVALLSSDFTSFVLFVHQMSRTATSMENITFTDSPVYPHIIL